MKLKIKKLTPTAIIPTKAHASDLGYDLYADGTYRIYRHMIAKIPTGICMGFPKNWGGIIKDRSSMARKGIITSGGVIDSEYTGEISIMLTLIEVIHGELPYYTVNKGDKIAQIVPVPVVNFQIEEVDALESTERGEKGFGSSGI